MDRVSMIRRMIEEGEQLDLFAPGAKSHKPWDLAALREAKGRKGKFDPKSRFSGVKVTVLDAVEQCDKVVVRWRLRGRWTQPILGLKPTGREVDITGVNFYRFVGDKIVEQTGEFDMPGFVHQARGGISPAACQEAMVQFSRPPDFEIGPVAFLADTVKGPAKASKAAGKASKAAT